MDMGMLLSCYYNGYLFADTEGIGLSDAVFFDYGICDPFAGAVSGLPQVQEAFYGDRT